MPDVLDVSHSNSSSSTGTSRSLIDRVRADDAEAWDRLVALYAPLVAHWCRRWQLPEQDTADVFQEVFQAVASHIGVFRREEKRDTFRGWLRTITVNKVHDLFRRQQREPRGVGGSEAQERFTQIPAPSEASAFVSEASLTGDALSSRPPPSEMLSGDDAPLERQLFRRALDLIRAEFEPRTWQAFWYSAVEGRPAKDVAADLGLSPGAVRVAKSRVLHRLRTELGDLMG